MLRISSLLVVTCLALEVCCSPVPHVKRDNELEKSATVPHYSFPFVTKSEWGGQPATSVTSLSTPVPAVVIHHSYEPGACHDRPGCSQAMRNMQVYHQGTQNWADIGYNFAVGGDGSVYEGRGWKAVGAHAVGFNTQSIGIVLIGDWVGEVPPSNQLEVAKQLIATGVDLGFISPEYRLLGHRQVGSTECPGEALFTEISSWYHFEDNTKF